MCSSYFCIDVFLVPKDRNICLESLIDLLRDTIEGNDIPRENEKDGSNSSIKGKMEEIVCKCIMKLVRVSDFFLSFFPLCLFLSYKTNIPFILYPMAFSVPSCFLFLLFFSLQDLGKQYLSIGSRSDGSFGVRILG